MSEHANTYATNTADLSVEQADQSFELLKAFFGSAQDYHVLLDSSLRIAAFNRYAATFTKLYVDIDLLIGVSMPDFIGEPFGKEFIMLCNKALAGEVIDYEYYIHTRTGESLWFQFLLTPLRNATNNIIGITMVGTNITQQKKQEKTIRYQSDTLSVIAQLQSHQVRQPVSSILGLMNLIKADGYNASKEYLLCLEEATHQLDEVIKTIVAQSRR